MTAAPDGDATLFISFREAADLSLQIALSVCVVIAGMSIAAVTAKSEQRPTQKLDVTRPVLWASAPVYVDRHDDLFNIAVKSASDMKPSDDICADSIGLRVTCELIVPDRKNG